MIGTSAVMREVYRLIARIAPTAANVLIEGETGTGKELVARALHAASGRRAGAFVAVNCAALPRDLVEAELFGTQPGAFTGAVARAGHFELAQGGTLFLDEIGDLSLAAQAALLRALDQKSVQRLGSGKPHPIDFRLISATHVDLGTAVAAGQFRADLRYRLQQTTIRLPPLRARPDDIPLLVGAMLPRICAALGCGERRISPEARQVLEAYSWPGNVRQLKHALMHAASGAPEGVVRILDLPSDFHELSQSLKVAAPPRPAGLSLPAASAAVVAAVEQEWIRVELGRHQTMADVAHALGIHYRTLYEKMAAYGLRRPSTGKSTRR
jgi:DNA-binding NtrC family response regulator